VNKQLATECAATLYKDTNLGAISLSNGYSSEWLLLMRLPHAAIAGVTNGGGGCSRSKNASSPVCTAQPFPNRFCLPPSSH